MQEQQKQRYLRNLVMQDIGQSGQEKLLSSKVLVIGAGGLGSPLLYYLSAAGIGNLGIMDGDVVELSNLQRQIIHRNADLQRKKVLSASEKIKQLNEDVKVDIYDMELTAQNKEQILEIAKNYDIIADATDNFFTRFLINEIAHQSKKPLAWAAVKEFSGQLSMFKSWQSDSPCYQCFNPNRSDKRIDPPVEQKGILGAVAGSLGCLQAANIVKELLGIGESLVAQMVIFDILNNRFRKTKLRKNKDCAVCGY